MLYLICSVKLGMILFYNFEASSLFSSEIIAQTGKKIKTYITNRGSDMTAHVLFDLLNEMRNRDKIRGLSSIL